MGKAGRLGLCAAPSLDLPTGYVPAALAPRWTIPDDAAVTEMPKALPRIQPWVIGLAALIAGYAVVFLRLFTYAISNEFNTYVLMVPPIAVGMYFVRGQTVSPLKPCLSGALVAFGIAASLLALAMTHKVGPAGRLALEVQSFPVALAGVALLFGGYRRFRDLLFPIALLICMVPLPPLAVRIIEHLLQYASAWLAFLLLRLLGVPVLQYENVYLRLPGITLQIAPACSGIQSTVALFVLSLAAGYVFLHSGWLRVILTLAFLPLSILRNAIRIVTVGELCSHYGPQMIDSYLHRRGGWLFFLIFLIPFFVLLFALMQLDRAPKSAAL